MRTIAYRMLRRAKSPVKKLQSFMLKGFYTGKARLCPLCGKSSRRFRSYGKVPRADAQCIHCGSLERHRLLWLFLQEKTDIFDGKSKKLLHVAPEPCIESRLRKQLEGEYVTADLSSPRAMIKMDIMDIQYPDRSFDTIYCSHVLEHVADDRQALREFFRILENAGWAILLVPITCGKTFEDPSIIAPEERLKVFGQEDHVRRYGPDYAERLGDAGFTVTITSVSNLVDSQDALKLGITQAGDIYYCTK